MVRQVPQPAPVGRRRFDCSNALREVLRRKYRPIASMHATRDRAIPSICTRNDDLRVRRSARRQTVEPLYGSSRDYRLADVMCLGND